MNPLEALGVYWAFPRTILEVQPRSLFNNAIVNQSLNAGSKGQVFAVNFIPQGPIIKDSQVLVIESVDLQIVYNDTSEAIVIEDVAVAMTDHTGSTWTLSTPFYSLRNQGTQQNDFAMNVPVVLSVKDWAATKYLETTSANLCAVFVASNTDAANAHSIAVAQVFVFARYINGVETI